ncbi:MAG: hypothetical protein ACREEM_04820 [Blastocatellia bacterium]
MKASLSQTLSRRQFVGQSLAAFATAAHAGVGSPAGGLLLEDAPNTHNMMIVGEQAIFLSHLPMFDSLNRTKSDYTSPHRYQVIVEADFVKNGKSLRESYAKDRQSNLSVRMYTLNPKQFVLPRLFAPAPPLVRSFSATVFRGHLERGGQIISGMESVTVSVTRVVHAHKFDPAAVRPDALEYLLFGKGTELLLAHRIVKPPEFDQLLSVAIADRKFTDEQLSRGLRVVVSGRTNSAPTRLKEQEAVEAAVTIPNEPAPVKVQFRGVREFYFEEGELLIPPTFDQTSEEKKAGF